MTFITEITELNACSAFNSAFVATVASFVFKSEFFTRLEISD